MIKTASIITKMLEKYNIKPIIVGGLSVDTLYIESRLEVEQEKEEFKNWLEQITKN